MPGDLIAHTSAASHEIEEIEPHKLNDFNEATYLCEMCEKEKS